MTPPDDATHLAAIEPSTSTDLIPGDTMLGTLRSFAPPVLAVAGLGLFARRLGIDARALLDPTTAAAVVALPWLVLALSDSWGAAVRTARDLTSGRTSELPGPQSHALEARLRAVGAATIGIGVFAAVVALTSGMNDIARRQGQADAGDWPLLYGGFLLGPGYALLLEATLYGPARARLRSERALAARVVEGAA